MTFVASVPSSPILHTSTSASPGAKRGPIATTSQRAFRATATPQVDYVTTFGNVLLAPGETNKTVRVAIVGDSMVEPNETFFFYFSADFQVTTARDYAVATILDDDGLPGTLGTQGQSGRVSCASCHVPASGSFVDTRSPRGQLSLAASWTPRRTPALLDLDRP